MSCTLLDPFDRKVIDGLVKSIGPQGVVDFVDRMKAEKAAFKEAKKVRLPAKVDMEDVLRMYPISIVKGIASEWNLNQNRGKNKLIGDIIRVRAEVIPDIIDEASDAEREAIKYVAEHGNLKIKEARRILNDSLIQPEFTDPDDPGMFDAFMEVYTKMGILIMGVREVRGRDREIVTLASDVKRIVAKHTGWNVAFDPSVSPNHRAGGPRVPAGGKKQAGLSKGREQTPKRVMTGMPLGTPPSHHPGASIFKRDGVEVKKGHVITDPFEAMTAYAIAKYRNEFETERKDCPYDTRNLGNDTFVFKQHMTWFLAEWINPATGTTIVEEFVKETVTDRKVANMLLQFTELFFDRFVVKEHRGSDIIAYGTGTRRTYRIVTAAGNSFYPIGTKFEGRIHPYEGKYKTCGIIGRYADPA